MKLPGSLIYDDEDLDEAAKRVLNELTGLKNVKLTQFKAYGSKDRTRNPKDVLWLERFHRLDEKKIDRIVTIAYLTLVKIDRRFEHCGRSIFHIMAYMHQCILQNLEMVERQAFHLRHRCPASIVFIRQLFDLLPGSLRRPS